MKTKRRCWLLALAVVVVFAILFLTNKENGRVKLPAGKVTPQVSIGEYHGLILAGDGSIWSWGGYGRGFPVLGLGKISATTQLRRIGSDTNWISVAAGGDHSLALKSDGTIWAWGGGIYGNLGDGMQGASNKIFHMAAAPICSVSGNDWTQVIAGEWSSFALKKDGTLWAWGLNNFGRLGIGSAAQRILQPTQVGTATNWVKVRAGGVSGGGIQSDGSLWIWGGSPKFGNSSKNSSQDLLSPVRISADTNWVDLSVAYNLWLGIKSDGTLWAWGKNAHLFTDAPQSACETPTQIGTNTDWQSVSSSIGGTFHLFHLLRKRDGSFWIMHAPNYSNMSFKRVDFPKDIVAFDGRSGTAAVLTRDGEVWTCGIVLGKQTTKDKVWNFLREQLYRLFGKKIPWQQPATITRDEPWQLRNVEPTSEK